MLLATEDTVCFIDNDGAPRALRGRIVYEDSILIRLARRDGNWEIYKKMITKVRRRGRI